MFIVHIGKPKCGSTSLQSFMTANARTLESLGVFYATLPKRGRPGDATDQRPADVPGSQLQRFSYVIRSRELLARNPDARVVVSNEGLSKLDKSQVGELRSSLGPIPVTIIAYVRELSAILPSLYSQHTKKGANRQDFDRFYESRPERLSLVRDLSAWGETFGWENLRVRSLDAASLTGGSLISDFLSVIGLSLADFGPAGAEQPHTNRSLGWKTLEVLRACYSQLPVSPVGNPRDGRGLIAALLGTILDVMRELGLTSARAQYLSAKQWAECDVLYRQAVDQLNGLISGPALPSPRPEVITERPFLPTIDQISPAERREIARCIQSRLVSPGLRRAKQAGEVLRHNGLDEAAVRRAIEPASVSGMRAKFHETA